MVSVLAWTHYIANKQFRRVAGSGKVRKKLLLHCLAFPTSSSQHTVPCRKRKLGRLCRGPTHLDALSNTLQSGSRFVFDYHSEFSRLLLVLQYSPQDLAGRRLGNFTDLFASR